VAPAVAEASMRHLPLVVISADRPAQWIGQQVGQTLDQPGALSRFTLCNVNVAEPLDDSQRWYCNRQINEALLAARQGGPVHINVPLSEPLFSFTTPALPTERVITCPDVPADEASLQRCLLPFMQSSRPLLVIGQMDVPIDTSALSSHYVVLNEALSGKDGGVPFDEVLPLIGDDEEFQPEYVLYMGGTLVSKHIKQWLARCNRAVMMQVSPQGAVCDTFTHVTQVLRAPVEQVLRVLEASDEDRETAAPFVDHWNDLLTMAKYHYLQFNPNFSQMLAVKVLERYIDTLDGNYVVHYANSQPVRLANMVARHHVVCNRGVNGIEGTVSAAAGNSMVTRDMVLCVTGDLSFFYDRNALWPFGLKSNLRILLLNNGGGGIFSQLPGLSDSPALERLVSGYHLSQAEEWYGCKYRSASGSEDLYSGITWLLNEETNRPLLLEVFTSMEKDQRVLQQARESLKTAYQSWKKENGKQ